MNPASLQQREPTACFWGFAMDCVGGNNILKANISRRGAKAQSFGNFLSVSASLREIS